MDSDPAAARLIQQLRYEGQTLATALGKFSDARLWTLQSDATSGAYIYSLVWEDDVPPWEFVADTLDDLKEWHDDQI